MMVFESCAKSNLLGNKKHNMKLQDPVCAMPGSNYGVCQVLQGGL